MALSGTFVEEAKIGIAQAFAAIIGLESGKLKPDDVNK